MDSKLIAEVTNLPTGELKLLHMYIDSLIKLREKMTEVEEELNVPNKQKMQ